MDLSDWARLNCTVINGSNTCWFPRPIEEDPASVYPYIIITGLMMLSGTVGNIMVIGAVYVNKRLRTVGNVFIVNLAIADLSVTGFVDPFSIIGAIEGALYFKDKMVLCEAVAAVCLITCFCSLLNIGAISFNRYIHICHNQLYAKIYTLRNGLLMCVGIWVISLSADLPNFFGWGDHVYDMKTLSCIYDRLADFSFTMFFVLCGIAFPITLISICYALIFLHVRRSKKKIAAMADKGPKAKERRDSVRLARTLFIIFIIFATCWTPYAIIVAIDFPDKFHPNVHTYAVLIAHTNSSLNSILYGLTNVEFRRGYARMLGLEKWLIARRARMGDETSVTATQVSAITEELKGSQGGTKTAADTTTAAP